jgi:hypothetical protein
MTLFPEVVTVISVIAQFLAGTMAVGIFIFVLTGQGFDMTRVSGNTTTTGVGYGFMLAVFLAIMSVWPLFTFDDELHAANFPTPAFFLKFWIIFFLELCLGLAWLFRKKISFRLFVVFIPAASVGASWCGKSMELMVYFYNSRQYSVLLKIVYEVLGAAYVVGYFSLPLILVVMLQTRHTESKVKAINAGFEALKNGDKPVRIAALNDLDKTLKQVPDPEQYVNKLLACYFDERDFEVRNQICQLLTRKGRSASEHKVIYWTAFAENASVNADITNTFTPIDRQLPIDGSLCYYDANGYNIAQETETWKWVNFRFEKQLPDNFDIELATYWKRGEDNNPYGLLLGLDENNFLVFCISGNGQAMVGFFQDQKYVQNLIPWKKMEIISASKNTIKVEVRGKSLNYRVNGHTAGSVENAIFGYQACGPILANKQAVCYRLLKIREVP